MASTTIPLGLEIRRLVWKDDSFRQADHAPAPGYGTLGWWDIIVPGGNAITFSNTGSGVITTSDPVYGGVVTPGVFGLKSSAITNGDELYLPTNIAVEKDFPVGIPTDLIGYVRVRAKNAGLGTSTLYVVCLDSTLSALPDGTFSFTLDSSLYTHYSIPAFYLAGHYADGPVWGVGMYCSNGAIVDYVALASSDYINQGGQSLNITIPKKTDKQTRPMTTDIIQQLGISSRSKAVMIPKISTTAYTWLKDKMNRSIPLEVVSPTQQATGYLSDIKRHTEAGWVGNPIPTDDSLAVTAQGQQLYDTSFSLIKADNEVNIDLTCPVIVVPPQPISVTVGTVGKVSQRKVFFANGRYWAFILTPPNWMSYTSSADGYNWATPTQIRTVLALSGVAAECFSTHFDGTYVHYVAEGESSHTLFYRRGIPNITGIITWSKPEQHLYSIGVDGAPSVTVDSTNHPWVMFCNGSAAISITKSSTTDGTWVDASGFPKLGFDYFSSSFGVYGTVAPLTGGVIVSSYAMRVNATKSSLRVVSWNPSQGTIRVVSANDSLAASMMTYGSDTAYMVWTDLTTTDIMFSQYSYSTQTATTPVSIGVSTGSHDIMPMITVDPATGYLYVFWYDATKFYYSKYSGGVWSAPTTLFTDPQGIVISRDCFSISEQVSSLGQILLIYCANTTPYMAKAFVFNVP
jgi:hypothetical protein